jgi:hypothetical protein
VGFLALILTRELGLRSAPTSPNDGVILMASQESFEAMKFVRVRGLLMTGMTNADVLYRWVSG